MVPFTENTNVELGGVGHCRAGVDRKQSTVEISTAFLGKAHRISAGLTWVPREAE